MYTRLFARALSLAEASPLLLRRSPVGIRMARLVMKFGGTSVADIDCIRNVARHVKREVDAGHEVAVVVSAMAGKTTSWSAGVATHPRCTMPGNMTRWWRRASR